jgi:hypothetical protein
LRRWPVYLRGVSYFSAAPEEHLNNKVNFTILIKLSLNPGDELSMRSSSSLKSETVVSPA